MERHASLSFHSDTTNKIELEFCKQNILSQYRMTKKPSQVIIFYSNSAEILLFESDQVYKMKYHLTLI